MDSLAVASACSISSATNGAFLLLSALGLIVILGMMNIINLAHGELMMLGAYTATIAVPPRLPFPLAVIAAFVVVALFGAVLERLIVRRFYGRELGALVVTWGISLILAQGTLHAARAVHAVDPDPGRLDRASASIRSRSTGLR